MKRIHHGDADRSLYLHYGEVAGGAPVVTLNTLMNEVLSSYSIVKAHLIPG